MSLPLTSQGKKFGKVCFYSIRGKHIDKETAVLYEQLDPTKEAITSFINLAKKDLSALVLETKDVKKKERYQTMLDTLESVSPDRFSEVFSLYAAKKFGKRKMYVILDGKHLFSLCFGVQGFVRRAPRSLGLVCLKYDTLFKYKIKDMGNTVFSLVIPILTPNSYAIRQIESTFTSDEKDALIHIGAIIQPAFQLYRENKHLKKLLKAWEKHAEELAEKNAELVKEMDAARQAAKAKPLMNPSQEEESWAQIRPRIPNYFAEFIFVLLPPLMLRYISPQTEPTLIWVLGAFVGFGVFVFLQQSGKLNIR